MPYLIFDLEMSGTVADFHDIIQIGAVLADNNWNKIAEFESLVYPDNPETFSKYSEEIHGISLADLEEAPSSYEVMESFEKWIRKNLRRTNNENLYDITLCGQSVVNDINFLRFKYDDLNIQWPFSSRIIDLMSVSFLFFRIYDNNGIQRPKSLSLKSVSQMFNLARSEEQHNALEDAILTYNCFKEFFILADKIKLS